MPILNSSSWVVVGLDNGGNCNSATVLDGSGRFLVDRLVESPSRVREGPEVAVEALVEALDGVLGLTGVTRESVRAVGLGTPGPASRRWGDLLEGGDELLRSAPGAGSTSAPRSSVAWAFPSSTTTTATPLRSTPITRTSAARLRCTPRSRRSSAQA